MSIRDNLYVSLAAAAIVGPATFILGLYWFTNDPTLRPLGITEAKLASAGMSENNGAILTTIHIPDGAELGTSRANLERAINNAFDTYNTESRFRYVRTPNARGVSVTFSIGKSQIGPYPINRASEGIRPTAQAHRMLVKQAKATEQRRRQNMTLLDRVFAE
ncbi:MAG: hypothetical protein ACRBBK_04770 [Paracoccaceae bacterium]